MSLAGVFDIAATGMSAQTVRLNTTASNLANAQTVAGSAEQAYRARRPVFEAVPLQQSHAQHLGAAQQPFGVMIRQIIESDAAPMQIYEPNHPMANEEGYVFHSNVNSVEEMADMISASRSYQMNVEMMNTTKSMMQRLLSLGN